MPLVDLAIPVTVDAAIVVDARADEAAWADALVIEDFVTFQPTFDGAPSGRTTARVLADDRGLWFHVTAVDPEPDKVRAGLGRRDTRWADDWVGVYVDPAGQRQRAYLFLVNPLGVQSDGTNASGAPEDPSWDARWRSAGRRTDAGYEVEFGVPWRAVRHPANADQVGLFVFRHVARSGEKSSWPRLDPEVSGLLAQEAVVGGPGPLPRAVGLELVPSLTFAWDQDGPVDDRLGVAGVSPGLTARWSPTPALQALGTLNPDFSQVESDTAQIGVNRRFALYLQEKRPFFLEGQEWFGHPWTNLVYTRSMVAPLYGVRATAEAGGWTAAALHVLDAHPSPSTAELGGWTEAQLGDAPALDTVVRGRAALGADAFVGALWSDRVVVGAPLANRVGALDARVRLSDRWTATAAALGSVTTGATAERLAPAGLASVDYASKHLGWSAWGDGSHPDFRAENGFVTETDGVGGGTALEVRVFPKSKVLPAVSLYPIQGHTSWTASALAHEHLGFDPAVSWVFGNGGGAWTQLSHNGELYGGEWLVYDRGVADVDVPWSRWLSTGVGGSTGTSPLYDPAAPQVGWRDAVSARVRLQPAPSLSAEVVAAWERFELDGVGLYDGWVGRLRVEAFASRRLWLRGIAERATFTGVARAEGLVAWEHSPGSALYVGGARTFDDPWAGVTADPSALGWQVFAKGSWVGLI